MKQLKAILIGAGSRGAKAYAPFALEHPEKIKFIAVAEPDVKRRQDFMQEHGIPLEYGYESYEGLLQKKLEADVIFVCTQDHMHKDPVIMALEAGYDVVTEKPISNTLEDSEEVVKKASKLKRKLVVCHVLRYTGFFGKIKEIIDSGEIGEVVSISLNENVGYAHAAHSYVRGNWRNEALSSPMILAKSCHDTDILQWLIGSPVKKVSSFGGLKHFKKENAPKGSCARCLDGCAVKAECPFDAEKIYMDPEITAWPVNVITADISQEGRHKALLEGPYGRCVYHCDNDVVDHQVAIMEYENGATTSFAMNSLSAKTCRQILVYGDKGQLSGMMEEDTILKQIYGAPEEIVKTEKPGSSEYAHGGGDAGLMEHVCAYIGAEDVERIPETDAIVGHRICFAAEDGRKEDRVVCFE